MDFIARKIDGEIYVSLDQVNSAIEEKNAEIENIKATHYAEMVDAGMRELKLKRALWLIGAMLGKMGSLAYHNIKAKLFFFDDADGVKWALKKREQWENVERKCRAKAELYK